MESTLALTLDQINSEVGHLLGYGRGSVVPNTGDPAWDVRQVADIDSCVKSGQRRFYHPMATEDLPTGYDWSFMHPTLTVQLAVGQNIVVLPDDFAGFEGPLTIQSTAGLVWWPINLTNEALIRQQYAVMPVATGRPLMAAVMPLKGTSATQGTRQQLFFWPNSDGNYNLQAQYYVLPDAITEAFPFPFGGMQHAETILESCLAIAEERLDDEKTTHADSFRRLLLTSVNVDRRLKPQKIGYNRDMSDQQDRFLWRQDLHGWNLVSVYGVQH